MYDSNSNRRHLNVYHFSIWRSSIPTWPRPSWATSTPAWTNCKRWTTPWTSTWGGPRASPFRDPGHAWWGREAWCVVQGRRVLPGRQVALRRAVRQEALAGMAYRPPVQELLRQILPLCQVGSNEFEFLLYCVQGFDLLSARFPFCLQIMCRAVYLPLNNLNLALGIANHTVHVLIAQQRTVL